MLGGGSWPLAVLSTVTRGRATNASVLSRFHGAVLTEQAVQRLHAILGSFHLTLNSVSPLFWVGLAVHSGGGRINSPPLSHPVGVLLPVGVVGLCHMLVPFQLAVVPRGTCFFSAFGEFVQPAAPKKRISMLSCRRNKEQQNNIVSLTSYY